MQLVSPVRSRGRQENPARHRLFRRARLVSAGLALVLVPLLVIVAGEEPAVAVGLLLVGLLPAVIALDVGSDGDVDRALRTSAITLATLVAAISLRGLPLTAALVLTAAAALELQTLARRPATRHGGFAALAIGLAVAGGATLAIGSATTTPATAALATALGLVTVTLLVLHLAHELAERRKAHQLDLGRLEDIESVVKEVILCTDPGGAVRRVAGEPERVLGLAESALLGRGLMELTLVADRPAVLTALSAAAAGASPRAVRFRLRAGGGRPDRPPSYRYAELAASPSRDGGVLALVTDIEATLAGERRADQAEALAERERRAREAFLSTVNHELRTPLNAVIGFSELMANPATVPADPARAREYAGIIHGAGHDLLRMVNAMIDITRLDAGSYELKRESTDLTGLARQTLELFAAEPQVAGYTFVFGHGETEVTADADPRAIRQVLLELLSNAAKFGGGTGEIRVNVGSNGDEAAVAVTDPGAGLGPEALVRLGEAFNGGDQAHTRAKGGMGLGLALADRLVRRHGGRLTIAAAAGGGTVVSLHLPLRAATTVVLPLPVRARQASHVEPTAAAPEMRQSA
jgi:cell cycle sensor histidine kinase DivJ